MQKTLEIKFLIRYLEQVGVDELRERGARRGKEATSGLWASLVGKETTSCNSLFFPFLFHGINKNCTLNRLMTIKEGRHVFGALSFVLGHTWYQIHHLRLVYILGLGRPSLKRHLKVISSCFFL